ncbi:MAG: FAD/NAD(P)-binding protein [Pseudomonadota bacterium]
MTSSQPCRIHVIGAGLAGSAVAMLLAKAGVNVTLYDAGTSFGSRWTRSVDPDWKIPLSSEPDIFYDPDQRLSGFFAQWSDMPDDLITPAHVMAESDEDIWHDLKDGLATGLISSRTNWAERLDLAVRLWALRYADPDQGVKITKAATPVSLLGPLADFLLVTSLQRCSAAQLGKIIMPRWRDLIIKSRKPVFSAMNADALHRFALPRLKTHFIEMGGVIVENARLDDIDSTADHATDLLFGETQIILDSADIVIVALPPTDLYAAIPDLGIAPAPARRRTFVFKINDPATHPAGWLVDDDLIGSVCHSGNTLHVTLACDLVIADTIPEDHLARTAWQLAISLINPEAAEQPCPDYRFVIQDMAFPEFTPGMAALRPKMVSPWRNLFLCGDVFASDMAPGPAAAIASAQQVCTTVLHHTAINAAATRRSSAKSTL